MAKYTKNMTEGSEFRIIITFTLPLLLGNLFQQFYNIVDSIIVGQYLGSNALAAVGATGSMTFLFYTLCIGLSVGTGILIAQHFGAGNEDYVKKLIAKIIANRVDFRFRVIMRQEAGTAASITSV